jgi:hypothetical protein
VITPALPPEVLAELPGLERFGRTTTRLHPRPAVVSFLDSHVGGPLRWPADEPWPVCEASYLVAEQVPIPADLVARLEDAKTHRPAAHVLADGEVSLGEEIARLVGPGFTGWGSDGDGLLVGRRYVARPHPRPNPLVALAQLRAADIPDLPRPGGADLLQLLWCPFDHDQDLCGPALRLAWRRESDVVDVLAPPLRGQAGSENYLPRSCRLHPEQVVEYPYPQELPGDLRARAEAWEGNYLCTFMAPGWKVGGYAAWNLTDLLPTPCPSCAGPTTLLLVIDSTEYDGGTRERWRPIEEQHIGWDHPKRSSFQEPTGITVGRSASLRVFACLRCPGVPFRLDLQ